MKTPPDKALTDRPSPPRKLTPRPVLKASIYLVLLLPGQAVIEYQLTRVLSLYSLAYVLKAIAVPLIISLGLEMLRWWWHRWRGQKTGQFVPRDPFWFQVVEGGFAIWLLIEVVPALLRGFVF